MAQGSDNGTSLQDTGKPVEEKAFYTDYLTGHKGRRYGTIAWHDSVVQLITDENVVRACMSSKYLPMLVSPPTRSRAALVSLRFVTAYGLPHFS